MRQLEIKVLDITDARCNHEVYNGKYRVRHKSINTPLRHKSVNTPLSHERPVGGLQDGGRCTHVTHFVQLYPQPLYTASQVLSWDKGVLTDLCLTLYYSITL